MEAHHQDDHDEPAVSHWLLFTFGSFLVLLIVLPTICSVRRTCTKDKEE